MAERLPHGSFSQDCLSPFVSGGIIRSCAKVQVRPQLSLAYVAYVEMCKVCHGAMVELLPVVSPHRSYANGENGKHLSRGPTANGYYLSQGLDLTTTNGVT